MIELTDSEFAELFESVGPTKTAQHIGITMRRVYNRRREVESRLGRSLTAPDRAGIIVDHPGRIDTQVYDGTVLIGSDAHFMPGNITTAFRAFVRACKELQPKVVVMNGDILDAGTISRHPPIGWQHKPSLIQEVEECKDRMGDITVAAEKAERYWPLGNHDARFSTRLATVAPEYANIHGVSLSDHFADWEPCWMVVINDSVVVKHRFKGGIHATHNNTLWAGKTLITGHLHSLKVTPFTDYSGTRFGVDCGTLSESYSDAFADYTELSPVNWRAGFIVLTFVKGRLLWPEVCHVISDDEVEFRGKLWRV